MLKSYLIVFFISMLPLIELRGAIPVGIGMGLPILPTYLVCVVGNMLPVPFIYLFARKVLIWGYHKPIIGPFCRFCIVKGEKEVVRWKPRPGAASWRRCCSLWASRCRVPAHGPARWPRPSST